MSRCRECGQEHLEGALFCGECGAYLLQVDDPHITLAATVAERDDSKNGSRPLDYRLGFGIKADRIVFVIPSSGRKLELDLDTTIEIGRVDTRQGIWPEVDFTPDEGVEKGVSRRHAQVCNSDEGVVLVDLGSTNGTQVNDRRLHPNRPHLLSHGDVIRFGRLLARIYFDL